MQSKIHIPDINGDRCVHAHIEQASCKACVTACPVNAWILDDESLGLDTDLCDGCGLCIPACSEGAISQQQPCTIREENNRKVLLLGCEYTQLAEANCKCVHSLSLHDLLKLYCDGIKQIEICTSDCDQCSRGDNESLDQRISYLNKALQSRGLATIQVNKLTDTQWQKLCKSPEKSAPGADMSRRMFFRSALKQTVDLAFHFQDLGQIEEFKPLGEIFPTTNRKESELHSRVYSAVPVINTTACSGCDACVRACPHQALILINEDDQPNHKFRYQLDALACTACNICKDICESDAIEISHWSTQQVESISLSNQRCEACGADYHLPVQQIQSSEMKKCLVCRQINHHKHLFQVLKS